MKDHGGGSHSRHSRPDEKMGSPRRFNRFMRRRLLPTTAQRQVEQNMSNRKRRQRDRLQSNG